MASVTFEKPSTSSATPKTSGAAKSPNVDTISKPIGGLKLATDDEFAHLCREANVSIEQGRSWAATRKCGQEGERLLTVLRERDNSPTVFSVGFTSVLAGTLLADEFIRDYLGAGVALNGNQNHAVFQFFNISSPSNSPSFVACEQNCPACDTRRLGLKIWQRRFAALEPKRQGCGP